MLRPRLAPARALRRAPAGFVVPCAPIVIGRPPAGPRWLHEIKQDGYRLIARKAADAPVRLWARSRTDHTDRFVAIAAAIAALPVASCTLDGEAVARPGGAAGFLALRSRDGAADAQLVAFDLLELDGLDLRREPVERRRERLYRLLKGWSPLGPLLFSEGLPGAVFEGADVFAQACTAGLEGIVSKRYGSIYRSGRSHDWVKTLNPAYRRI